MRQLKLNINQVIVLLLLPLLIGVVEADTASALQAMDSRSNPLLLIDSDQGNIYVELFSNEAPRNVANLQALVEGEVEIADFENSSVFTPRYFDGMRLHRVIKGLLIQTGSPHRNAFGSPGESIPDEINATGLGLADQPSVMPDGSFNPILQISDRVALEEKLLLPLYKQMDIGNEQAISQQQNAIDQRLRSMTIKQAYENLGYSYTERFPTRPITRGIVAMANTGPNSNGTEFFISVSDAPWLNGLYTVVGQVVEGMEIVDRINQKAVDVSAEPNAGALIYNIRQQ
jgi:peptidyl-prolyl cis-trans isomerase A (cyclophilin A)